MSSCNFSLQVAALPTVEPVSLQEAKVHCRIDETADNALVSTLITVARRMAEAYTRRVFMTQSWVMYMDQWPCSNVLEIPKAPLLGISSIVTYNDSDVGTTFSSANYYVDLVTRPGRVVLRIGAVWPVFYRPKNGIAVNFVAGYAAKPGDIPADIRQAILMTVAHLYENRGDAQADLPMVAQALLSPHKDWMM